MDNVKNSGFKIKTQEKIITTKMNHWLKTITNETLRESVRNSLIVTGGCFASMLQGDLANDFDVYLDNVEVCANLAQYYVDQLSANNQRVSKMEVIKGEDRVKIMIKSAGVAGEEVDLNNYRYFKCETDKSVDDMFNEENMPQPKKYEGKYQPLMITTNAISLSDDVQVITRFIGKPEEIHENYDFVHTTNYFTFKTGVVFNMPAMESIITKELRYVGSLYPICSLFRLRKFIKRGWTITAGQILLIAYDVSKLNLDDPVVLEDALTGVDAAYFNEVISIMKSEDRTIDRAYLAELLNRVFD